MKISHDDLWKIIVGIVPTAKISGMVLPQAITTCATVLFIDREGSSARAEIIREALVELKTRGWLEFDK
jgi:hypothetical protein